MARRMSLLLGLCLSLSTPVIATAEEPRHIVESYHLPAGQTIGEIEPKTALRIAIGLPARDPEGLRAMADAVSDPKSPQYRHFLTLDELTERFGPTAADYDALANWAEAHHLTVEGRFPHRQLLVVGGAASDVEQAFGVTLGAAKRPDGSTFYKPDRPPSLDLSVKISHVAGIDNLFVPKSRGGSLLGGAYYGSADLRNAYAADCLGLTGSGQSFGVMSYAQYAHTDITGYEAAVGVPSSTSCGAVPAGQGPCLNDYPAPGAGSPAAAGVYPGLTAEVTADIEFAIAMAPGMSEVTVFQGDPTQGCTGGDAILSAMLAASQTKQFSSSISYCVSDDIQTFQSMAAIGQSFFGPSGDDGTSPTGAGTTFNAYLQADVINVGGTVLTMNGAGVSYASEQAWPFSGGGVETYNAPVCPAGCTPGSSGCPNNCAPPWQQGVANAQNGASSTYRNDPDLAMPAQGLYVVQGGLSGGFCGTSASAP